MSLQIQAASGGLRRNVFTKLSSMPSDFPDPDLEQLLRDLEATGFDRDSVDIKQVLRSNPFYGDDNRKRSFARKFYQLRRNSLASYGTFHCVALIY